MSECTIEKLMGPTNATMAYIIQHGATVSPVLQEIEKADCGFTFATVNAGYFLLSLSGTKRQLAMAWHILRTNGFDAPKGRPEKLASSWTGEFRKGEAEIYLSFSSTICKRVQIGTETKEVPIYELRCDDGVSA